MRGAEISKEIDLLLPEKNADNSTSGKSFFKNLYDVKRLTIEMSYQKADENSDNDLQHL